MNNAHLHLIINHLPIIIPMIGGLIMLGGLIFKSEIIKRTAYLIFILGALFTFPAMATGDGAEDVVENIQGIDENYIEKHEEAAETFAIFSYILGGISLIGIYFGFKQKTFANVFNYFTLFFVLLVLFFAKETGTTGGEIRHTEIRQNTSIIENNDTENENEDD
jgi:hypothetical protein